MYVYIVMTEGHEMSPEEPAFAHAVYDTEQAAQDCKKRMELFLKCKIWVVCKPVITWE